MLNLSKEDFQQVQLFDKISCHYTEAIQTLTSQEADVNIKNPFDLSLLSLAAAVGDIDLVKLLINEGEDVNALNNKCNYKHLKALTFAFECQYDEKKSEVTKLLVEAGADVNTKSYLDQSGKTALHNAVENEDVELVKFLVNRGANVDERSLQNQTPLMIALECKADLNKVSEMIKTLIEAGADINTRSNNLLGLMAIHKAVELVNVELVRFLLNRGADVNSQDQYDESTPLHYVAYTELCNEEDKLKLRDIVRELKYHGADFYATTTENEFFCTAMECAIINSNLGALEHLILSGGIDVNSVVRIGESTTMLHLACAYSQLPCVKLLLKKGADINAKDYLGKSALQESIDCVLGTEEKKEIHCQDQMEVLRYLLKKNPDVNTFTTYGHNILIPSPELNTRNLPAFLYKTILRHIAKLKEVGNYIDPRILRTISGKRKYKNYFEECKKELKLLKNIQIDLDKRITIFNILTDDKKKLFHYVGNKDIKKKCMLMDSKIFTIYRKSIEERFNKALNKRKAWDRAAKTLSDLLPINVDSTHLITRKILSFFTSKDIRKICN